MTTFGADLSPGHSVSENTRVRTKRLTRHWASKFNNVSWKPKSRWRNDGYKKEKKKHKSECFERSLRVNNRLCKLFSSTKHRETSRCLANKMLRCALFSKAYYCHCRESSGLYKMTGKGTLWECSGKTHYFENYHSRTKPAQFWDCLPLWIFCTLYRRTSRSLCRESKFL